MERVLDKLTSYGSLSARNTTPVTSHSRSLTGLSASVTYHYRVRSVDAAGNIATSTDQTFTTTAAPDTTSPVISAITATAVNSGSIQVTWTTNEAATSRVQYSTDLSYSQSSSPNSTIATSHTVVISGLTPSTAYHLRVESTDAAGNLSRSADQAISTPEAGDTTPPGDVIGLTANAGNQQILLSWFSPVDTDFAGVRIRYRIDRLPSDSTDGELLGDFSGQPKPIDADDPCRAAKRGDLLLRGILVQRERPHSIDRPRLCHTVEGVVDRFGNIVRRLRDGTGERRLAFWTWSSGRYDHPVRDSDSHRRLDKEIRSAHGEPVRRPARDRPESTGILNDRWMRSSRWGGVQPAPRKA